MKDFAAVPDVIERLEFGNGQVIALTAASGVFLAEGIELLMISLLAKSIAKDLMVTGVAEGFMISSIFAGALVGNLFSGACVDLVGRQFPIILAYATVIFFGMISSFSNSLFSISLLRFFVGMGFGVGQPAAVALMKEVLPARWSNVPTACSSLFLGVGAFLAVLMVSFEDAWLKDFTAVEWRLLLRCATGPVFVLGSFACFFLLESPAYLAATGDHAYARDTLLILAKRNGHTDVSVMFRSPSALDMQLPVATLWEQISESSVRLRNFVLFSTWVVLNSVLYGTFYVVPQVLELVVPNSDETDTAPTAVLLLTIALSGVVLIILLFCGLGSNQKGGIGSCLLVSVIAHMLFGIAAGASHPGLGGKSALLIVACIGLCLGPALGLLHLIKVSAEFYPALTGPKGVALSLAAGRIGAIFGPLVFDWLQEITGRWQTYFTLVAVLELACAAGLWPVKLTEMPTQEERLPPRDGVATA